MSEERNDGGPAFPNITPDMPVVGGPGMSLRDWFAGQVLAGYAGVSDERVWGGDPKDKIGIEKWRSEILKFDAEYCYKMADAMLKAREK